MGGTGGFASFPLLNPPFAPRLKAWVVSAANEVANGRPFWRPKADEAPARRKGEAAAGRLSANISKHMSNTQR